MQSGQDIQRHLAAAWRMMLGRADGLLLLDLSVDGFWNSFFAIVVALPALIVGWVGIANEVAGLDFGIKLSLMLRMSVADIGAWVLPLAILAAVARPAGVADRFVHYVVASNWGSAIFAWMMLPPALLRLFVPQSAQLTVLISLALFMATLVLSWRLTVVAIGKGAAVGTAVFFGMLAASLVVLLAFQSVLQLDFQGG